MPYKSVDKTATGNNLPTIEYGVNMGKKGDQCTEGVYLHYVLTEAL